MFKFQQPSDLISRLYILEYMREIGAETMYNKVNKHQKENFFYKFIAEDETEQVDFNWEYCIFSATMFELEKLMENFIDEVTAIEEKRKDFLLGARAQLINEEISKPVDINLMDVAKAEIEKTRGKIIT